MEPDSSDTLNKMERDFRDYMQHGDDFFKIEMWRPAKAWYRKALALEINSEEVQEKIAECDRLMAYEMKVVWILAGIGLILALVIIVTG